MSGKSQLHTGFGPWLCPVRARWTCSRCCGGCVWADLAASLLGAPMRGLQEGQTAALVKIFTFDFILFYTSGLVQELTVFHGANDVYYRDLHRICLQLVQLCWLQQACRSGAALSVFACELG